MPKELILYIAIGTFIALFWLLILVIRKSYKDWSDYLLIFFVIIGLTAMSMFVDDSTAYPVHKGTGRVFAKKIVHQKYILYIDTDTTSIEAFTNSDKYYNVFPNISIVHYYECRGGVSQLPIYYQVK